MQNQQIKKDRINVNVCKQVIFYWKDSHDVYLTFARRDHQQRDLWIKKAKFAREQVKGLNNLIRFAQSKQTVH